MDGTVPRIASTAPRRLRVGEVIRHSGRLWRVDLVNACRARIVPVDRRHVRYDSWNGDAVEFDAADTRTLSISPYSEVERVDPSTLEDVMATKKSKSTPKEKATRTASTAKGDLCTFAIRITRSASAAIHKAAGPGKATKWASAVLAAAAAGDVEAVKAVLEGKSA